MIPDHQTHVLRNLHSAEQAAKFLLSCCHHSQIYDWSRVPFLASNLSAFLVVTFFVHNTSAPALQNTQRSEGKKVKVHIYFNFKLLFIKEKLVLSHLLSYSICVKVQKQVNLKGREAFIKKRM